jgi:2-amino-4-hydroxy-6-hydroxymethyldihydropteridine diphosphokinase
MHERAFVLLPLVEIAPEVAIPGRGPAKALLEKCKDQGIGRID